MLDFKKYLFLSSLLIFTSCNEKAANQALIPDIKELELSQSGNSNQGYTLFNNQLKAKLIYTDGNESDVTKQVRWLTNSVNYGGIDSDGLLTFGVVKGTLELDATYHNDTLESSKLTFYISSLDELNISVSNDSNFTNELNVTLDENTTSLEYNLSAIGFYSDDTNISVSDKVLWTSSSKNVKINKLSSDVYEINITKDGNYTISAEALKDIVVDKIDVSRKSVLSINVK